MRTALTRTTTDRLADDASAAGGPFETFAVCELIHQADASALGPLLRFFHFRDQRGNEVDLVVEHAAGDIAGVEVKSGATQRPADAAGLMLLRDRLRDRFR